MSNRASSTASRQPLRLTVRKDLIAKRQTFQGRNWWVVKDPLTLQYHRFPDVEFFLLNSLDGQRSLEEIQEAFGWEFPAERMEVPEMLRFVASLHQNGLVTASVPGQGQVMKERASERRRRRVWGMLSNILSIQFRGIDPDRGLTKVYPWVRWAFSPAACLGAMLLWLAALLLVVVQFDTFQSKLPAFHQFFTRENAFTLVAVLIVTKICHEFGHAFACKHFGGECHEIGVLLLVFSPCLYCNVSDAWMMPNKWHRMIIGAAGMYVELVIASIATFVWWYSQPGLLHNLCLSTMFVCSVSTVMFNANPLMRYDGYYILADYLEIPNLRQKSSDILHRGLSHWFFGSEFPPDPFMPQGRTWQFAVFTVASELYRWLVTFSIISFLYHCLEPYQLKVLGQILGGVALFALLIQPGVRLVKFLQQPGESDDRNFRQFWFKGGGLASATIGFLLIPWPHRVHCTLELTPRDAVPVYVEVAATLQDLQVRSGQTVEAGTMLAQLENLDLELETTNLKRTFDRQQVQLSNLRRLRFLDEKAAAQLPELAKSVASLGRQLDRRRADLQRLILMAPVGGTILPPPSQGKPPAESRELPQWSGTPLEQRNLKCLLPDGALFCHIGDPSRMWGDLVIDQADIEFVERGQEVTLTFDELPDVVLRGRIAEIARRDLQDTPRQLSNKGGGDLASQTDKAGRERPMNASYQARVAIDDPEQLLCIGCRGRANIRVASQSLGQWVWRRWHETFHFAL